MTPSPKVTRAALIARVKLEPALVALAEAATWLDAHGCAPVVEAECAEAAGLAGRWSTAPRETLATGVDAVFAFGGDGTLLDAAAAVVDSGSDAPLMGINLGRLGFLTEVDRSRMIAAFESVLAGQSYLESRTMIEGLVDREGDVVCHRRSLNDIVVTRSAPSRMVEIDVDVDGHVVCHVKADGLLVASPTGSTAYNLSVSGPIVHPSVDALVLTPIAPHTLTLRPLVLPGDAAITLRPLVESQGEVVAAFDGQYGVRLTAGDVVGVRRAAGRLRLLRTTPRTYFDMLREKLKWG